MRINNKVTVPLIVDTGASSVCISRAVANQLGIQKKDEVRTVQLTLADGRQVSGKMVFLKSVDVGGMTAKNVAAVILEISNTKDSHGLLGMSFLGNFMFHIDANSKKLVLDAFKG